MIRETKVVHVSKMMVNEFHSHRVVIMASRNHGNRIDAKIVSPLEIRQCMCISIALVCPSSSSFFNGIILISYGKVDPDL